MTRGPRFDDLKDKTFNRLTVRKFAGLNKHGKALWLCDCRCGNQITISGVYLRNGDTESCGCLKKELENKHLREDYDNKRVDGVAMQLFKGKEGRKDNQVGYRGVLKYYTRKSKELRYKACITVKGKTYCKYGFDNPEDAYYNGRLELEMEHLPEERGNKK